MGNRVNRERLLYAMLYLIIGNILTMTISLVVVVQFLLGWIGGGLNTNLLSFSSSLGEYAKEIINYLTFNSDTKPWPIGDWSSKK